MQGRIIKNYLDLEFEEGRHNIELNINGVSPGIYWVSIITSKGNKSVSIVFVILKVKKHYSAL